MKIILKIKLALILLCPIVLMAQRTQPKPPADRITRSISPKKGQTLSRMAFVNPLAKKEEKIRNAISEEHHEDKLMHTKFPTLYKEKNLTSNITDSHKEQSVKINLKEELPSSPVILSSFEANQNDGYYPSDNNMAISDKGFIVSVINSAISFFDANGNVLMDNLDIEDFFADLTDTNQYLVNPKVLYDPVADRFILLVEDDSGAQGSVVLIGFSSAEDPSQGWNLYGFNGILFNGLDPYNMHMGISNTDLFVSSSLYQQSSSSFKSVLLQMKKENGYQGVDMEWEYFDNVTKNYGLVPISHGYDATYGPGIFLVSTESDTGNSIELFEVTDSLGADQTLNSYIIPTQPYTSPPNSPQLGLLTPLYTGGCDVKNAFYADGIVHFVFHHDYELSGNSGIRYNRINTEDISHENFSYGVEGMNFAYPNVAPMGMTEDSKAVMIGCLNSNALIHPQFSAVNVDESGIFSDYIVLKEGESEVNSILQIAEPWGYIGCGRRHSSDYPNAWFAGSYGKSGEYGNWICELSNSSPGLAPIADFTADPVQLLLPGYSSSFTSTVLNGADTYSWKFEGGIPATSIDPSVLVKYETAGIFDVELIVTNEFGQDSVKKSAYIEVVGIPHAAFTSDITTGPAPLVVSFENLSDNIDEIFWEFGGSDTPESTILNPVVVYESPGSYNVRLTITNAAGQDKELKLGYINVTLPNETNEPEILNNLVLFPNPVKDAFHLNFSLSEKTELKIDIFDALGQRVKTLFNGLVKAGNSDLHFKNIALATGTYFIQIKDSNQNVLSNQKIVIGQ